MIITFFKIIIVIVNRKRNKNLLQSMYIDK